jgi:hypothetical protein
MFRKNIVIVRVWFLFSFICCNCSIWVLYWRRDLANRTPRVCTVVTLWMTLQTSRADGRIRAKTEIDVRGFGRKESENNLSLDGRPDCKVVFGPPSEGTRRVTRALFICLLRSQRNCYLYFCLVMIGSTAHREFTICFLFEVEALVSLVRCGVT